MIDTLKLKSLTSKDLAEMARKKGIAGWHSMRKDELVRAIVRRAKSQSSATANGVKSNGHANGVKSNGHANGVKSNGHAGKRVTHGSHAKNGSSSASKARSNRVLRRLNAIKSQLAESKDLAHKCVSERNGHTKDRLVVMVLDPYWLHVYWELTRATVERARVALGQHWHGAKPMLRVHEVAGEGTTSSTRQVTRHIEIHGQVNNWYVHVQDSPKSLQLEIGYQGTDGKFYTLARSNVVNTPCGGAGAGLDRNWEDVVQDCDRIYALSGGTSVDTVDAELRGILEERAQRPMGGPATTHYAAPGSNGHPNRFKFQVEAELVIFGHAQPGSHITLRGEPVKVQGDGSFAVRLNLPDRRQVLPVVASSCDGLQQRTIVLAVERNTKVMEPVTRDTAE